MINVRLAGALLALVVTLGCDRGGPPPLPDVIPLVPAGRIERVTEFRWQGPPDATFRLIVTDPAGVPLLMRVTTDTRIFIERDEAATFPTGGYAWYVEMLDENGQVTVTSRTQLFDVE